MKNKFYTLTKPQQRLYELICNGNRPMELYTRGIQNMAEKLERLGIITIEVNDLNQCFASKKEQPKPIFLSFEEARLLEHLCKYGAELTTKIDLLKSIAEKINEILQS